MKIEIDGRAADADRLAFPAVVNYGHFSAMQVRAGKVRGLDLHLTRLDAATEELFGVALSADRVRACVRHALHDTPDASVRVSVFQPDPRDSPSIMVVVRDPASLSPHPQRLRSVEYQRPIAHLKHAGTFGIIHYGQQAERDGFDDALLTAADGTISETTVANIGFWDGDDIVWPDAPVLAGITMQLLRPRHHRRVRLNDLPAFSGAFVTNSLGIAPVGRIDDVELPVDLGRIDELTKLYESTRWDTI